MGGQFGAARESHGHRLPAGPEAQVARDLLAEIAKREAEQAGRADEALRAERARKADDTRNVDEAQDPGGSSVVRAPAPPSPRSSTTWSQQAYVKASNTSAGLFSALVLRYRPTVRPWRWVPPHEASAVTGIDGNQADSSASNAGAVYVFR